MRIVEADTLVEGVSLAQRDADDTAQRRRRAVTVLFRKSDLADLAPDYFGSRGRRDEA